MMEIQVFLYKQLRPNELNACGNKTKFPLLNKIPLIIFQNYTLSNIDKLKNY